MRIREIYQSKELRDARYKELRSKGRKTVRSSMGPALLHPMYVKDFSGKEKLDIGFGNFVYKTLFHKLYIVEETL